MVEETVTKYAVPGEEIGVIEEGEPLGDYYVDDGEIRAKKVSKVVFSTTERVFQIFGVDIRSKPPGVSDYVVGIVIENLPEDMQRVRVLKVNGNWSSAQFTVIVVPYKSSRSLRQQQAKIGDVVRAKVIGEANGIIFAVLHGPSTGVLWTRCSLCGGPVFKLKGNQIKCKKCGHVEYRRLAPDFQSPDAVL